MKRKQIPKRRNLAARALESPLFRMRKIKPLKGKASYKRRPKHRAGVAISTAHVKLLQSGRCGQILICHRLARSQPEAFKARFTGSIVLDTYRL